MSVKISSGLLKKLSREARLSHRPEFLDTLLAESIARRWLLRRGLPCWRTSQPPGRPDRYGLLFPSGRRAMVSPSGGNGYSFNDMARAKCEYLLKVVMEDDLRGDVEGFFTLFDIRKPGDIGWTPDLDLLETRPMEGFPEMARRPAHFRPAFLLGSLKLLVMGELKAPPPEKHRQDNTPV
ncbi:MAG: hypothetical protein R6U39_00580 [Candidatus Aegiribacteria sp.]